MVESAEKTEAKAIGRFIGSLEKLAEFSPTMPVMQVIAFLTVAENEGKSLSDLVKISKIKQSTMSRYLLDLSDKTRTGSAGYGLIKRETDPAEFRRNMYSLTPRGRILVREILSME